MQNNPKYENVEKKKDASFKIGIYEQSYFKRSWHFHPEVELLLIIDGYGKRLVGDSIEEFKKDDLVLVGTNLPHAWLSDPSFYEPCTKKCCKSIYLQFDSSLCNNLFIKTPELTSIHKLLKKAERGLSISGPLRNEIIGLIKKMPAQKGINRFLRFISILDLISRCELKALASEKYLNNRFYSKSTRISHVHEFVMENFKHEISLKTAAAIAHMNESSFSRFFKYQTGKTFSEYLNELRIDFAHKLLQGTDLSISQIAFESGYNSLSHFNKKFKKFTGKSPGIFRKGSLTSRNTSST